MKRIIITGALAAAIIGLTASDVGAIGCGLFNRSSERQFTPVRNAVQRVRNVTARVADRVLPRRARVDYVEIESTERVQITGIKPRANCANGTCSLGF